MYNLYVHDIIFIFYQIVGKFQYSEVTLIKSSSKRLFLFLFCTIARSTVNIIELLDRNSFFVDLPFL